MSPATADPRIATTSVKADLVARAQAGDHAAFAILAKEAFDHMFGAAKLILRDQHWAEDAVQEALILAWRHVAAIRNPDAWNAWLYRLTVRACYRLARTRVGAHVAELDVRAEQAAPVMDFTSAIDDRARIMAALSALPLEQRAVIVLHFYLDLPLSDAAAVLNVPIGTAKSRLHR